jgi:hypothetical protein
LRKIDHKKSEIDSIGNSSLGHIRPLAKVFRDIIKDLLFLPILS